MIVGVRKVNVRELVLSNRISYGSTFIESISMPLPFKIPITRRSHIEMFPSIFEFGYGEYNECIDLWLGHQLISFSSEQAIVAIDTMWQSCSDLLP